MGVEFCVVYHLSAAAKNVANRPFSNVIASRLWRCVLGAGEHLPAMLICNHPK